MGKWQLIDDQAELYMRCAAVMAQDASSTLDRCISIASLHGHRGRRTVSEPQSDERLGGPLAEFNAAMTERITSATEPWRVRQLLNIVNVERLEQFRSRLPLLDGPHYEVRAMVEPGALPVMSPLVVGRRHVFLALDDDRLFRARSALYADDRRIAAWVLDHFEELWAAADYLLRDSVGTRDDEMTALRAAVDALDDSRRKGRTAIETLQGQAANPDGRKADERRSRSIEDLLRDATEDVYLEFKSSLRTEVPGGELNKDLEASITKTIAGFLNARGGTLLIGVDDRGTPIGLKSDYDSSPKIAGSDGFHRHLLQLAQQRLGQGVFAQIEITFPIVDRVEVCRVECSRAPEPVFERFGGGPILWVRMGNATKRLEDLDEAVRYAKTRWP